MLCRKLFFQYWDAPSLREEPVLWKYGENWVNRLRYRKEKRRKAQDIYEKCAPYYQPR